MKVVTFGEILLRLAAPGYTRLFQKDQFDLTFCGGEANVAVSLAILGMDSAYVTKLPDNDIGRAAANSMRYFGVDISNIIYGNGRMGLYYLEKGASQRPSKVIYDRLYSSFSISDLNDYNWNEIFDGADWFHWTGIDPALGGKIPQICENACKIARAKGLTVSCDLNYRKKLWSSDEAQKTMKPLMKYVDICICNEEDAYKVLGIKAPDTDIDRAELSKEGYIQTAKRINKEYGCRYIATTLRKSFSASINGWSAMLFDSKKMESCFSREYDIQIVDRVGGGDSFAAGLIYALGQGMNNKESIEFATAASCLKQTIEGDFNRITINEINSFLESGGSGRVQR